MTWRRPVDRFCAYSHIVVASVRTMGASIETEEFTGSGSDPARFA